MRSVRAGWDGKNGIGSVADRTKRGFTGVQREMTDQEVQVPDERTPDRSQFIRGGRLGVLLVHGLGGTPIELRFVAHGLARAGHTVYSCQLAGHCATPEEPLYDAKVTVLGEYIKHHAGEEETEMFPKVRKAKDLDLDALGDQLRERANRLKQELGLDS